jgi:hypothetical protein
MREPVQQTWAGEVTKGLQWQVGHGEFDEALWVALCFRVFRHTEGYQADFHPHSPPHSQATC